MNMQLMPDISVTRQMADWIASFDGDAGDARVWAQHVLLDWMAVTRAATDADNVNIITKIYADGGPSTLICGGGSRRAEDAALINGTAGHVLDYDDASVLMNGHATAPVAPAILALAEELESTGAQIIEAMIVGQEVECQLGKMMAPNHYEAGYHATATLGTIGAAAASARLMGLDAERSAHALGLAATQAAGLKSMFGSMTKSLQVGKAAANGIMAARLVGAGFTANPDGLDSEQGMGPVMSGSFVAKPFVPGGMDRWGVAYNAFKYHGACFMTHSAIEAARQIGAETGLRPRDVAELEIDLNPVALNVCDQPEPATGLETKFSIRHLVMAGLRGDPTADNDCYSDVFANDPELVAARKRVHINAPPDHAGMVVAANVRLVTHDGALHTASADVGALATDTDAQWDLLCGKARAMLPAAVADDLITAVADLENTPSGKAFMTTALKSQM